MQIGRDRGTPRLMKIILPIIVIVIGAAIYFTFLTGPVGEPLKVKVIDSSTGQGLNEVNVSVDNQTKTTDSEGWVTFHLPSGEYTISLRKTGYRSKQWTTHIPLENMEFVKLDLVKKE